MIFQATSKFVIVSVKLILPKVGVQSDKKMICKLCRRSKGEYGDYCSHFSMTLETSSTFLIVFVRLILGKRGLMEVQRHDGKLASVMSLI